jgi:hypothetical protein
MAGSGQSYVERPPVAALAGIVSSVWIQQVAPGADDGLALLAAEAGYADQPHLNRECLRLPGVSPRTFVGEAEDTCACGHDHAASFAPLLRSRPL